MLKSFMEEEELNNSYHQLDFYDWNFHWNVIENCKRKETMVSMDLKYSVCMYFAVVISKEITKSSLEHSIRKPFL